MISSKGVKKEKNSKMEHVNQRTIDCLKKKNSNKFPKYFLTQKKLRNT